MTMLLPLAYLLLGWLCGKTHWNVKTPASWLLTRFIIPLVIIYNLSTHFSSMAGIIVVTALAMVLMLMLARWLWGDAVKALCFAYLNIGWLGLPIASALFGNEAAAIIIAAYVGSSLVGNSLGASMLASDAFSLRKIIQTPPAIALAIGILLIPVGPWITQHVDGIYQLAKFLMSFLGMAVLGIWLAKTPLNRGNIGVELKAFLQRAATVFVLVSLLYACARIGHFALITDNAAVLYLFCLLPPAANIIVLETHYLGTGRSASMITCGTCISLVAIALYSLAIIGARLLAA